MKNYSVVAFDLDGTLTDPAAGLVASYIYAFKKMGIKYGDPEGLKRFIGPPIHDEWQKCYGLTPDEATEAVRLFREHFNIYGWWDNRVYDGIPELLCQLKASGKKIVLATSKPEQFARKIIVHFGLDRYFDFIGGATYDGTREYKWEVLKYSLDSVGCTDLDKAILVGDRVYDAEGAAKVGIDSLGVLYGHGSKQEIESSGFTLIAKTVKEVGELLV